jgi:ABC-type glycerol-3-phosphate transport system substrate-binding protein
MKQRQLSAFTLLIVIVTLVLAVSGTTAQEAVTIRFQHHEAQYTEEINTAIAAFEAANPNITVESELVPWVEAFALQTNQAATGNLPDVFVVGNTWVAPYAQMGALADLTARIDSWETDSGPIADDFYPGDKLFYNLDGKWFGLPYMAETRLLFYRTDWLEAAALELPTTHEEFTAVAQALTNPDEGHWGFGLLGSPDGVTFQSFVTWAIQRGANLFKEDDSGNLVANINSPEYIEAIQWYTDLLLKEQIAPSGAAGYALSDVESGFQGGSLGMIITGPWFIPALQANTELEGKWNVAPLPAGPANDFTFLGGYPLVMASNSQHPEEAWLFMQFMTSKESILPYAIATNIPPAYQSMAGGYVREDPILQIFIDGLQKAVPNSYPFEAPAILASMTDGEMPLQYAIQAVLNGELTPEEAAIEADIKVNEMLTRE